MAEKKDVVIMKKELRFHQELLKGMRECKKACGFESPWGWCANCPLEDICPHIVSR